MLDTLKHPLRDQLALPPWVVLVALGLAAHLGLNALLRRPPGAGAGLLGAAGDSSSPEPVRRTHQKAGELSELALFEIDVVGIRVVRLAGQPLRVQLVQVDLPVPPDRPAPPLILGPLGVLRHHLAHELGMVGFVQRHLAYSR